MIEFILPLLIGFFGGLTGYFIAKIISLKKQSKILKQLSKRLKDLPKGEYTPEEGKFNEGALYVLKQL